jgi:acyl-homoserine lactone acylase PvdQ
LSTESHQYDATPMDNLAMRVLRPGLSGLAAPTVVTGARSSTGAVRRALDNAIKQLSSKYGQATKSWRRAHGISHIESLTGVIGPSTTMPFEDRGTWVQHVAFTTGRPFSARPSSAEAADGAGGDGGELAATGSNSSLPLAGLALLVAACATRRVWARRGPGPSR